MRLTPLDKAEITAREWRGQSTGELASMFGVTKRTINRVVRKANAVPIRADEEHHDVSQN